MKPRTTIASDPPTPLGGHRLPLHRIPLWAFALTTSLAVGARANAQPTARNAEPSASDTRCSTEQLPGIRSHLLRGLREAQDGSNIDAATMDIARVTDFSRVAKAVFGDGAQSLLHAVATPTAASALDLSLPCGPTVRARDDVAWRMGLAGFSAKEIGDVIDGHLTLADIGQARARLMAGQPRHDVASFLEQRWRSPVAKPAPSQSTPPRVPTRPVQGGLLALLEPDLVNASRWYGLDPGLVRAVVAAESGGNPGAVSSAGAIGLMQLMPTTAAMLRVNPWHPRENLWGGVSYLASLVRAFGNDLRLALIAYNAGPQHARAVQAGRAVAYRETRAYLDAIARRYPIR